MNKLKAFIASAAATAILPIGMMSVNAYVYGGYLDYILCGDEAIITGFEGSPEILELPCEIDGKIVTEIRENAFYKCESLKKIIIPESVEKIGHHAFYECDSLETAEIYGDIKVIDEGTFYSCSVLNNVSLPEGLTTVGDYSFYGCENLRGIDIPDSVTNIGEYAFADCKMLAGADLPEKLVELGAYAFLRCGSLYNITLPDGVMHIGSYSLGFAGEDTLVPMENFVITGDEDALGKIYAEENRMQFESKDKEKKASENNRLWIPGILIVVSGAGLLILKSAGRIAMLEMKYEYEG
ncbi:leucine-rich repeat domain-containing protein [Porcipelethomonas sp.]|uniref:leucine-rich repeat domain-containing protein n=1 Tax=Porcipelethomonas sp. TaxID=2981675 RepID=UPI003EF7F8C3